MGHHIGVRALDLADRADLRVSERWRESGVIRGS